MTFEETMTYQFGRFSTAIDDTIVKTFHLFYRAGYTEGKRIQEKEHAEQILTQLAEQSQQLGLYDDNATNPMIKDQ